eukprot:4428239-Amphidinium_carterae.1
MSDVGWCCKLCIPLCCKTQLYYDLRKLSAGFNAVMVRQMHFVQSSIAAARNRGNFMLVVGQLVAAHAQLTHVDTDCILACCALEALTSSFT